MQNNSHGSNRIPRKRIRRSTNRNNTTTNTILAQNPYYSLSDDDIEEVEEMEIQNNNNTNSSSSTKSNINRNKYSTVKASTKPPPIIVTDEKYNKIEMIMDGDNTNIKDYIYKQTTLGMKIFVQNKADFDTLVASMVEKKIEFYTHRYSEEKIMKVVLRGLPQLNIEELKTHFVNEWSLRPLQIYEMKTNNANKHSALYLVHLNKNDITFNDLQKRRALNHTIISWAHYKPKYRGPTICNKCSSYGHGASNCNKTPHCLLCAGPHEAKHCALRETENINEKVFKCYNCSKDNKPSNHKANDIKCPFRQKYLDIKSKSTSNRQSQQHQQNTHQTPVIQASPQPTTPRQTASFNTRTNRRNHTSSYADQVKYGHQQSNEELFSISQLLSIFKGAVSKIKQCRTKMDQIQVIASLLEYVV